MTTKQKQEEQKRKIKKEIHLQMVDFFIMNKKKPNYLTWIFDIFKTIYYVSIDASNPIETKTIIEAFIEADYYDIDASTMLVELEKLNKRTYIIHYEKTKTILNELMVYQRDLKLKEILN